MNAHWALSLHTTLLTHTHNTMHAHWALSSHTTLSLYTPLKGDVIACGLKRAFCQRGKHGILKLVTKHTHTHTHSHTHTWDFKAWDAQLWLEQFFGASLTGAKVWRWRRRWWRWRQNSARWSAMCEGRCKLQGHFHKKWSYAFWYVECRSKLLSWKIILRVLVCWM